MVELENDELIFFKLAKSIDAHNCCLFHLFSNLDEFILLANQ